MKKFTINAKLILLFVTILLIFSGLSWLFVASNIEQTALNDTKKNLHAINTTKVPEIQRVLQDTKKLLLLKAKNLQTITAFHDLNSSFYKIHQEISLPLSSIKQKLMNDYSANYLPLVNYNMAGVQPKRPVHSYVPKEGNAQLAHYMFITKNPAPVGKKDALSFSPDFSCSYMNAHKTYHPQFRAFIKSFGLYDFFLINLKGDVIYTVFKEKDFATNLFHGPYARTDLAKVYKKSLHLQQGEIAFSDYAPYEPSYNKLASFIATPIFEAGKKTGILIFQMPLDVISQVSSFTGEYQEVGLGKTGDSFLLNSNYRVFTKPRLLKEKIFQNIVTQKGFQKDFTGGAFVLKEHGIDYLVTLHKINVFKETAWLFVTQMQMQEILKPIDKLQNKLLLFILSLLLVFVLIYTFVLKKIVINPLHSFSQGMESFFDFIGKKSKTLKPIQIRSHDEIGEMTKAVNENIENLVQTFQEKEEHTWIQQGVQNLDNKLLMLSKKEEMFQFCITCITEYCDANIGIFYLYDEEKELLTFVSGYAVNENHIQKNYRLKEGIIGEVAATKGEKLTKTAKEFVIESALLSSIPKESYVFALAFQNKLVGVMELATLKKFQEKHFQFLRDSAKSIAASTTALLRHDYIESLLMQTKEVNEELQEQREELQEQTEELRVQSEELQVSNAQMQEQQTALQEAKDKIEQSLKYKSEFLANMSHELRTPLNSIILLSKLLAQDSHLDAQEKDKCNVIHQAGQSLLELINDILDLSKIESNKLQLSYEDVTTQEIVTQMYNLFIPIAEEKGIKFTADDAAETVFSTDKMKLLQVIKNLLSNALKFTKEGSVHFHIQKNGKELLFSVEDNGIGIAKEKQESIFEAFVQADGSTSREFGGTGLGLSISKKIVDALGGSITIESSLGKGTTFYVTLPLTHTQKQEVPQKPVKEEKTDDMQPIPRVTREDDNQEKEQFLKGKYILIVDDDSRNIFTITAVLEEMGAEVISAFNGQEALEALQTEHVDLILMDIMMPVMDGIKAIKKIKSTQSYAKIPLIVLSAKNMQEDIDSFFEAGADEYLPKPLNLEALAKILHAWI